MITGPAFTKFSQRSSIFSSQLFAVANWNVSAIADLLMLLRQVASLSCVENDEDRLFDPNYWLCVRGRL